MQIYTIQGNTTQTPYLLLYHIFLSGSYFCQFNFLSMCTTPKPCIWTNTLFKVTHTCSGTRRWVEGSWSSEGLSALVDFGKSFFLDGEDGARGVKDDRGEEVEEDRDRSVEVEGEEEEGSVSSELRRGGSEWLRRSWGGVREWTWPTIMVSSMKPPRTYNTI